MKEIEVKILDINVAQVIKKLEDFGAVKIFDGEMQVKFYDFKDKSLRNSEKRLRLRTRGDKAELTYKKKISKEIAKIEEELQVNVDDFKEAQEILKEIGLVENRHYAKHRISYRIRDVFFEIDKIADCPPLMEIEAPSIEEVYEWVEKLGFNKDDAKPWSGSDVRKYYQDKKA